MKLVSWNVNSINARLERVLTFLELEKPDILLMQETKCQDEKFPKDSFIESGYEHLSLIGQKTYNGVAIASKKPVELVTTQLTGDPEEQARFIHCKLDHIHLINVYVPNGKSTASPSFKYKLRWLDHLIAYLKNHDQQDPVFLAGDLNIAPTQLDIYDENEFSDILCTVPEREKFRELLETGLIDLFRSYDNSQTYSWWDYRQLAFPKNRGARIDFILVNEAAKSLCSSCYIIREMRKGKKPSDHAPVATEFSYLQA